MKKKATPVISALPSHLQGLPPVKFYRSDYVGGRAQELRDRKIADSLKSDAWDAFDEMRLERDRNRAAITAAHRSTVKRLFKED